MNNINLLNNALLQTDAEPERFTRANAASSSHPQESPERFEEELSQWCEEKSGANEYRKRIQSKKRMIECFKTSDVILNLSFRDLTSIPSAIGALTNLRKLVLADNHLTSLPSAISALANLSALNLSSNQFISYPDAIFSLRSLRTLDLSFNHFTSMPSEIGLLTGLRDYRLIGNQLTMLPSTIGLLRGLNTLNLSRNQFASFPSAISSLTRLRILNFQDNQFISLSSEIGSLTSLRELYLSGNQLTSLPSALGLLTNLNTLEFSRNQLTSLPAEIGRLRGLYTLECSRNQFTSLPAEIGLLTGLRELYLSNNELTSLPGSIMTLSQDCFIEIYFIALSVRVLTNLREETGRANYHGPRFSYSMPALTVPHERPLTAMISELYRIIGQLCPAFPNLEAIDRGQHLRSCLNRLSGTATYQRGGDAKRKFVSQIVRYLETAEKNEEFRSILMPILENASQTCGDRVALSILHVGLQHRLYHFDLNDAKGLSQFLICGLMTLNILEQYARELAPTFRFVDEIEVYLGLPVMLKDRLNIPIDVSEMLYFRCSNLTEAHLEIAATRVRSQIDDLETRYQFLIGQSKWLEALEKRFPREMAIIHEEYAQKLESRADPLSVRAEYEEHLKVLTKRLLQ